MQDLNAIIVCTAWILSVFGWSIAHRAFELAGTEVHLGSAVSLFHVAMDSSA